jgi:hypothetical protein
VYRLGRSQATAELGDAIAAAAGSRIFASGHHQIL